MKPLEIDGAAALMSSACHLPIGSDNVRVLAAVGILPSLSNSRDGPFSPSDVAAYACKACPVDPEDIYSITRLVTNEERAFPPTSQSRAQHMLIVPLQGCGISFANVPFILIQQLLRGLDRTGFRSRAVSATSASSIKPMPIGACSELTVWTSCPETASVLSDTWRLIITRAAPLSEQEVMATPKLFGNKSRMANQIAAIAKSSYPQGASALDLMCGTGIVARTLADQFKVHTNDGNLYGRFFSRMQFATLDKNATQEILETISRLMEDNRNTLRSRLADELDQEAEFLHSSASEGTLSRYRAFCSCNTAEKLTEFLSHSQRDKTSPPYCFATAHYANAYFGLAQAIDIDSIRFALDRMENSELRDSLMGCLLAAANTVSSNLYFAQPPILSSPARLKKVLRLRSLDVFWEFAAQLQLVSARAQTRWPMGNTWTGDWRTALRDFSALNDSEKFVYVDPPYSKLQYSRYYHVLNVLAEYNYPDLNGNGRYPALTQRFSSKFEHRPNSSLREFIDLFSACAELKVGLLLSYSDEAFVRPDDLFGTLCQYFGEIEIFSQQIRHSPPGSKTSEKRRKVSEYVISCKL